MSEQNDMNGPARPSAAEKLGHQVRRALLLVAVVVGLVAAYWIWERFHIEQFQVQVIAADDPLETLAGYPYTADELLDLMDFSATPSPDGPALALDPAEGPHVWSFGVRGDDRRNVKNLRLQGMLAWRGSSQDGLRIPLQYPVVSESDGKRYMLTLTINAVQDFYDDSSVLTVFKVVDRDTRAALPGLRQARNEVEGFTEGSPGIYELQVNVGNLLEHHRSGADSLVFHIVQDSEERAAERLSLSVPLAWFFRQPAADDSRVLAVEFVTEVDPLCPWATDLAPRSVRQDRWPDRLVLSGEFLDRTSRVLLRRRGQDLAGVIARKTPTRLEWRTDSPPAPGRYEVILVSPDCDETSGGRLDVTAALVPLRALPLAAQEHAQGEALALRWQHGHVRGPLAVEVSGPGGVAPWRRLATVEAALDGYTWPQIDLAPGAYMVRLVDAEGGSTVASWQLEVAAPREITVVLHFVDGDKDWRVGRVWVDGIELTGEQLLPTGSHARVPLALGEHAYLAKGKGHDQGAYLGSFVVEPRHNFQNAPDFDTISLDRAESRRRD